MSFCRNCGTQLVEGAVFCTKCGTRDIAAAPDQNIASQTPKKRGLGYGISSMILGCLGLLYSFVLMIMVLEDPYDITEAFGYLLVVTGGMPAVATILSIFGMSRGRKNGFSKAGLITGLFGIFFVCLALFLYVALTFLRIF